MKRLSIAAALMVCALAFALVGCAPAKSVDKESLTGFWVLDDAAAIGFDVALSLEQEDDMAEMMVADSFLEGTWSTDGTNAEIKFEGDSGEEGDVKTVSMFVSEGKLVLGKPDGLKLVFSKGDMDAYFAEQDGEYADGDEEVIELDENGDNLVEAEEKIDDITPVPVIDDDVCTIQVTGKGNDFTGDPGYRLSVKNNSKKTIYISADDVFKVGDKEIEAGVGDVIEPGETTETFLYFPKDELGGGVENLKKVTGKIVVGDDETGDEIKSYPFKMD